MVSYKIYLIRKKIDIEAIFSSKWLENVKVARGDLESLNQKIDSIKETVKSPKVLKNINLAKNGYTLDYQYNITLPSNIKVWIPVQLYMIQTQAYLFVSKGEGKLRFLVEKYLSVNFDILPVDLKPKRLLTIWNNLRKNIKDAGHIITMHRLIIGKTFLEADPIQELNISTKNVEEIGIFKELMQSSQNIKVITFKIRWNIFDEDGKRINDLTVRLDSSGNILVYGDHPNNIIDLLLENLSKSI